MMITIDVIDLDLVVMLEEQPTRAIAPALLLQQLRQSRTDVRVPSLSRAPVHPITIVRTAVARDLNVPRDRNLTMVWRCTVSGSAAEVAKVRRLSSRCQYRCITHAVVCVGCRWCAQLAELFPGEKI